MEQGRRIGVDEEKLTWSWDCESALTAVSRGWARYAVRALQDMSVTMCQVPSSGTRMRHFGSSARTSCRLGKAVSGYLWLESVAGALRRGYIERESLLVLINSSAIGVDSETKR